MTKNVVTISKDKLLTDAAYMMIGAHISSLVVSNNGKPAGILTERDFIKKIDMGRTGKKDYMVADIMTGKIVTVEPDISLFAAQKIMHQHNFRKLVVAQKEKIVGIITQTDLCKAIAQLKTHDHDAPKASEIMTKKVITASPDESFQKVKKVLSQKDMGSMVIEEKGNIMGIFTEADIVSEYYLNPNRLRNSYMENLMTIPVICISPDFNSFLVNKLMLEKNFRRFPVVENGQLVGIITQTDIANALYQHIEKNKDKKSSPSWTHKDPQILSHKKDNTILLELKK
jgi:predicted transcriptional regulator